MGYYFRCSKGLKCLLGKIHKKFAVQTGVYTAKITKIFVMGKNQVLIFLITNEYFKNFNALSLS